MTIDLYGMASSAPCRTVMLTAAALGVKINLKNMNFDTKDHLAPEFVKINPQHCIPTIVDDGFALWESRTIARYLVNKYGKNSSLYPTDPQTRALVDQRLDFDFGTLYAKFAEYFYPQFRDGSVADPAKLEKLEEVLGFLNTFLEGHKYAVGSSLTIADLCLVATVATIESTEISLQAYPNIVKWYALVKSTAPEYKEINEKGIEQLKELMKRFKSK